MFSSAAPPTSPTSRDRWLMLTASLATLAYVGAGSLARVAGDGCLGHWPLCAGRWFPPLEQLDAIAIVYRSAAAVAILLVGSATWVAWRRYRQVRWIAWPALCGLGLFLIGGLMGAVPFPAAFQPYLTVLHFAVGLLWLAATLIATTVAFQLHRDPRLGDALLHFDVVSRLAGWLTVGLLTLLLAGAVVAELGAGGACRSWPLCDGALLPVSPLGWLHMAHRGLAAGTGLLAAASVLQAWRLRPANTALVITGTALGALFVGQVLIGAANLLNGFPLHLRGLHAATGIAIWAGGVVFAVLALQAVRLWPLAARAPARSLRELRPALADYLALTKPIIMLLLLTTTAAAMVVAGHGWPPLDLFLWTMLGGALASGGASALNQVIDRDLDRHMARTARRPLAQGRLSLAAGLAFGLALTIASFYVLAVFVNYAAAALALAGTVYYVIGYSVLLKKATPQNIVIGGGAGAVPPLVGWAAVTGRLDVAALFLFALVFFWTPPHFWALSLLKKNDYARAGVPMLPVVAGEAETRRQIVLYTLVVVALSLLLAPAGVAGLIYLVSAAALGLGFVAFAVALRRGAENRQAWRLYKYSSLYLALMFAALVVDRLYFIAV